MPHVHLFETAIGNCALVWQGDRILGSQLPEVDANGARRRLERRFDGLSEAEPTSMVEAAVGDIRALLSGEARSLLHLPIAIETVSAFARSVYEIALSIPPGETLTYGEVARRIGDPGAARAVGVALGHNPWPIIVPCHRVLAAGGRTGGFSARGGIETKLKVLTIERARTTAEPALFEALPLQSRPR